MDIAPMMSTPLARLTPVKYNASMHMTEDIPIMNETANAGDNNAPRKDDDLLAALRTLTFNKIFKIGTNTKNNNDSLPKSNTPLIIISFRANGPGAPRLFFGPMHFPG